VTSLTRTPPLLTNT